MESWDKQFISNMIAKLSHRYNENHLFTKIKSIYILSKIMKDCNDDAIVKSINCLTILRSEVDPRTSLIYFDSSHLFSLLSSLTTSEDLSSFKLLQLYGSFILKYLDNYDIINAQLNQTILDRQDILNTIPIIFDLLSTILDIHTLYHIVQGEDTDSCSDVFAFLSLPPPPPNPTSRIQGSQSNSKLITETKEIDSQPSGVVKDCLEDIQAYKVKLQNLLREIYEVCILGYMYIWIYIRHMIHVCIDMHVDVYVM